MKAEKQLWESRAKQILKRNEVQPDENSNADDAADSADGANNNEPQAQLSDDDRERTWYERKHWQQQQRQQNAFKYWTLNVENGSKHTVHCQWAT